MKTVPKYSLHNLGVHETEVISVVGGLIGQMMAFAIKLIES